MYCVCVCTCVCVCVCVCVCARECVCAHVIFFLQLHDFVFFTELLVSTLVSVSSREICTAKSFKNLAANRGKVYQSFRRL